MAAGGENDAASRESTARLASRLAYAGFLPVAALTLWLAAIGSGHPWRETTAALLSTYAALALVFVAGVRWGLAFLDRRDQAERNLAIGVVAVAAAWAAAMMSAHHAFVLLALAFAAHGAWDAFGVQAGTVPGWYGRVRTRMTFLMVAAMIVAFVATD